MSNQLNAAQLAARKIKAPKRRLPQGQSSTPLGGGDSVPQFATGGGLFGGSMQAPANNSFNFAAPVNPFGNNSVSFPPAVPGQGTPAKPEGFNMSFAGQPSQPQQGGLFGASFGGQQSNPFGQSSQPASTAGSFNFGQNNNNNQQAPANPFANQNAQAQKPSSSFNFGSTAPAGSSAFNFGASQAQPPQSQQTPGFSFGSTAKTEATNSFGQTQTAPAAPSNLFGGFNAQKTDTAPNPFGLNNQAQGGSAAGSQFGGSQPGTREASPFQFGAQTPAATEAPKANPFQFGATAGTPAADKPASSFNFGQTQQAAGTPTGAPANNLFGNNGGSQASGQNLFGNTQQNATPATNLFGAKPQEQQNATPSLFGASSQASQPTSTFNFGQTSGTPASAPANNMFGGAKPANPFGNLNVPASGSSTPFGQPSRSASPEKAMSDAEQKPAPAQNLFGGSQTPKPAAPTNLFGAAKVPQTAPQQASQPSLFGKPAEKASGDAPKNIFGGLPQPAKAPVSSESPAKPSLFSSPPPKANAPSLFAPPKQAVESPKPASQSLFGNTRAPSKLSEVTNASPAASPIRPSIEKPDDASSTDLVQKPSNNWNTSTKDLAKSSGALSKPVAFDHADSMVKAPQPGNKRDQEIYASKSDKEINAMFELYVGRSKLWDENEFLNPYSYRKIAMMCAKYMKSNMSEREQLEAYCLVQIRIAQRRAKEAFDDAVRDEDEEKQLKVKYFYEYKEKDIMRWAERQVEKGRRRAMDLEYEEEYESRRRSKRTAQDFDDEERLQIEENATAKRRKASTPPSPPKLLTNGESGSTTPRAPPPQKSLFGSSTPAAAPAPKSTFGSFTPAAAPPQKIIFRAATPAAPTPAKAAPTPATSTPSAPTPSFSDTPKSKRKAENQFDKDDPYGEKAAASAKKNKSGSATSSLFKSIVGKPAGDGRNATPERKIATPGKKLDTPKTNPFAALPGASSPAPAVKANPFGGLPSPAPKADATPKTNLFGSLPKPKSPVKAAAPTPGGFQFKPSAPAAGETPKANPFQAKPSASTPAAPVTGGFKPTVSLAPAEASDAFAKAAAAAKKKARIEEMERAKDEDWESDGSVDEDEWEKRYWKKKEQQDKEFEEKLKNPTLKVPSFGSFGSSFGANKPVEDAKDISRSGTQSPNSVLDSHTFGTGKITGAAAKNPFAHLSAATSPASSGKNDADDEDDKAEKSDEKSDEKSAEKPKGDLFSRTSFDPKAATPSLLGSSSKAADQTYNRDTPLKFAPSASGTSTTNIFGASTAAPASFGGLFGSKDANGTSTPSAAAPKTSGFSFGGASTETPTAKTPSIFGNLNKPKISETPIPPPKPFSFLTNGKSSGITSSFNTSRATTPGLTTEGEATADEAAASGDADPETVHEQMKDLASGEEAGEETLWMSRASCKEFKDGKWATKGLVGMLKVLKNKETARVRYLMRLENGSIVLNRGFLAEEPVVHAKSLTILMPEEGGKVGKWLITVKTPEKIKELAEVIRKCKKA